MDWDALLRCLLQENFHPRQIADALCVEGFINSDELHALKATPQTVAEGLNVFGAILKRKVNSIEVAENLSQVCLQCGNQVVASLIDEMKRAAQQGIVEPLRRKKILVMGATGVGKSSFCSRLLKPNDGEDWEMRFGASSGLESCTLLPQMESTEWGDVDLVDTPGLMDSGTLDAERVANTVTYIKSLGNIDNILILFNMSNHRMNSADRGMLRLIANLFPNREFWIRTYLVYTHASFIRNRAEIEEKRARVGELVRQIVSDRVSGIDNPLGTFFVETLDSFDEESNQELESLRVLLQQASAPVNTVELERPDPTFYKVEPITRERKLTTSSRVIKEHEGENWLGRMEIIIHERGEQRTLYDGRTRVGAWEETFRSEEVFVPEQPEITREIVETETRELSRDLHMKWRGAAIWGQKKPNYYAVTKAQFSRRKGILFDGSERLLSDWTEVPGTRSTYHDEIPK